MIHYLDHMIQYEYGSQHSYHMMNHK